ncbi:MAG TPA: hypothetical protein VGO93_14455 [Candidatus Xenobia bacterium]|jgi:hypothetical protein
MITSITTPRGPQGGSQPKPKDGADATFNYNAQDSTVLGPGTVTIHNVSGGASPSNDKVKLSDALAPNKDGSYNFKEGDKNEVLAQSFAAVAHTVDVFGQALGQPINWAFSGPQLTVNADAGEDFNAYYTRDSGSVNFFHGTDPKTNQVMYSGDSGEVVSHETGHAILDSLRPAYFSSFTPDVAAFHESTGDMMGICMSFQDPATLDNVAKETGGDLSKDNAISRTGEQLGIGINDVEGKNVTGGNFVRDALNTFKWADPSTLSGDGSDPTKLGSEAHDFSRLWTGAFYDVVKGINAENLAANPGNPKAALQATGKEAIQLLAELLKGAPQGDFTYRDMANSWVASDKANGGKRADLITKVMTDRGILGGAAPTPAPPHHGQQNPVDDGGDDGGDDGSLHNTFTMTQHGMKPLDTVTHGVTVKLGSNVPEQFQGAKITTLVDNDGALAKDSDVADRSKQAVANLIKQGRILVTSPGQKLSTKDYFDKQGRPFAGVLRYNADGSKTIERVKIAD